MISDAQYNGLQMSTTEIEKKNSWGKNELIILIGKLAVKALDSKESV